MAGSRRVAVAGRQRQDDDDLDAHGGAAALRDRPVVRRWAASWPSTAPTRTGATGDVFVVEADESDGSFLVYRPEVASSPTCSPTTSTSTARFEMVQAAYAAFAASIDRRPARRVPRRRGVPSVARAARADGTRVLTYGFDADADVVLRDEVSRG